MFKKRKPQDLHGKHFVCFLRKFGEPSVRTILWESLLGYEICYWNIDGEKLCYIFNPNNRCVAVNIKEFYDKYMLPLL